METELQSLESSPSRSMINCPSNISIRDIKYTSLKDVFTALDPPAAVIFPNDIHDFSSSTISIKNQLVKHAASAYLQSAAIFAARDQNWMTRMWRRTWLQRVLNSRWHECVRSPVGFCIRLMMRTVRGIVARAASHIVMIRSRSGSVSSD